MKKIIDMLSKHESLLKEENSSTYLLKSLTSMIIAMDGESVNFQSIMASIAHSFRSKMLWIQTMLTQDQEIMGVHCVPEIFSEDLPKFWKALFEMFELRNAMIRLSCRNIYAQILSGHFDMRSLFWALEKLNQEVSRKRVGEHEMKEEVVFEKAMMKKIMNYCFP